MSGIWGALTSDLKDFVKTVAEDTTTSVLTVNDMLSNEESVGTGAGSGGLRQAEAEELLKLEADVYRSYSTYAEAPPRGKFASFLATFTEEEESVAQKKAALVEEETDVCRHYMELVPRQISPETFWARLFYRLSQLHIQHTTASKAKAKGGFKGGLEPAYASFEAGMDEMDEEEEGLSWDDADDGAGGPASNSNSGGSGGGSSSIRDSRNDVNLARIEQLSGANDLLKRHVKALTGRVTELEGQLKAAQAQAQAHAAVQAQAQAQAQAIQAEIEEEMQKTGAETGAQGGTEAEAEAEAEAAGVAEEEAEEEEEAEAETEAETETEAQMPVAVAVKALSELDLDMDGDEEEDGWD